MAMGTREPGQIPMFLTPDQLPEAPTAPFFDKLNELLAQMGFDAYVEQLCRPFYAERMGRPSLAPGVYFRLLLLGCLLGIDSERGIALTVSDSLGLRRFLGYELQQNPPDHSTLSRTRRRISLQTHEQVFAWVLQRLREAGLAAGRTVAVDATMLFANAALRTLRRKDSQEEYREFVEGLAAAAGVPTPTLAELAAFDRKGKGKTLSNKEWESPTDPERAGGEDEEWDDAAGAQGGARSGPGERGPGGRDATSGGRRGHRDAGGDAGASVFLVKRIFGEKW